VATIARVLGVADGTVKTQLSRARAALQPLLALEETDHVR
jgi:DNA-directed RNA polymerase specialized sigma24 family protein